MSNEVEMNEIIANFNNDKSSSSYSLSSEDELESSSNSENKTINLIQARNDEFLFYNNENSNSDCPNNDSNSEIESMSLEKSFFTSNELFSRKDDIIKLFYTFDVVIFTDDYRINLVNKSSCYCWLTSASKKYIDPDEFPGILFLSFISLMFLN